MKKILLDGSKMLDQNSIHKYLKKKFNFPDYYGENLDALWDMLISISEPMEINLNNKNLLIEDLDNYGRKIIQVFLDADKENPNITFQ